MILPISSYTKETFVRFTKEGVNTSRLPLYGTGIVPCTANRSVSLPSLYTANKEDGAVV